MICDVSKVCICRMSGGAWIVIIPENILGWNGGHFVCDKKARLRWSETYFFTPAKAFGILKLLHGKAMR